MGVSDYEGAAARNASALMAVLLPLYWGHLYPGGRAEPQKACGVTAAGALTLHHLPPVLEFQHFAKHEKFPEVEAVSGHSSCSPLVNFWSRVAF